MPNDSQDSYTTSILPSPEFGHLPSPRRVSIYTRWPEPAPSRQIPSAWSRPVIHSPRMRRDQIALLLH